MAGFGINHPAPFVAGLDGLIFPFVYPVWDEFIIALLVSRFDVTLPVEIWSLLRSGLNPKTNAVGSLVFIVSIILVFVTEFLVFGRRKSK